MNLSQDELKELLDYDPATGNFTWIKSSAKQIGVGEIAGTITCYGYIQIKICKKCYTAHRLAFLYMTGNWPNNQVDHINRIRNDNRWINLRQCSHSQNLGNSTKRCDNTSGYKGVVLDKRDNTWQAKIGGKNIGRFTSKEDAALAYNKKAVEIYGEFAHLNKIITD